MTEPTDEQADALLDSLHRMARAIYPSYGLPIWGEHSQREEMRARVRQWVRENSPEVMR